MKSIVLAALLACAPLAALAAEADQYMTPGDCAASGNKAFCLQSAKQFRDEFPRALKGEYDAQRNVAYCLTTGCDDAVKVNKPIGCAWRAVILSSGSRKVDRADTTAFDSVCRGKLTASEATVFGGQYETLFRRIYRRTAPPVL